jgi:hypothetical protein
VDKPVYQKCYECLVEQMIRCRAFEIWEWRVETDTPGDAASDWREAETEVLEKLAGGYRSLR